MAWIVWAITQVFAFMAGFWLAPGAAAATTRFPSAGVLNVIVAWVLLPAGGTNEDVVFTGPVMVSGTVGPFWLATTAAPVTCPAIDSVPLVAA